jgi:phosphonate transport system permease protein
VEIKHSPLPLPQDITTSSLEQRRPGFPIRYYLKLLAIIGAVGLIHLWAWQGTEMDPGRIIEGTPRMWRFLGEMVPPNWTVIDTVLGAALETLQIAIIGTTVGAVIALPLGFMAANNVARPPVRNTTRILLNGIRSVPVILYALFFVVAVGLGPMAGTLAIIIYSVGMLGKFYSEAVETIDPRVTEAIWATGATRLQVLRYAVLPQVLPHFVDYTLYRLEINFREATILGLVGAGGIGFYITLYMRSFTYDRVATITLVILVVVMALDLISSYLRSKLV